MKKLVFVFAAFAAISFASCGNKAENTVEAADSTEVVDSAAADTTVVADSAAADTTVAEEAPAAE